MKHKTKMKLFTKTGALSDVVLNWYGQPIEKLDLYARAYHEAAKKLVDRALGKELRDIQACPVVYLYRHALELWLKEILIVGFRILKGEGQDAEPTETVLKQGHNLLCLWMEMQSLFKKIDWNWDAELSKHEEFIREFYKNDPESFRFRYPVKLDGTSSLGQNFSFDLRNFCTHMDKLLERLDQIDCGMAGELDRM